ncbi:MAG: hypothetical protein CL859_03795 [Cyanobium sp. ARS6]|nr:hypothetical protein [Cyanobium sp. ARS6]
MLLFKDNADNIVKIEPGSGVVPGPDAPDSPSAGDLWFDTDTELLYYYNGSDWVELGTAGDSPVSSVNGKVGTVVLTYTDVGAASAEQGGKADTAVQPGDNVSVLANDAGYLTSTDLPPSSVVSVNGETGIVVLDAGDVGALPADTPLDFVPLGSWDAIAELS